MPLLAAAFHDSVSVKWLTELFHHPANQLFAGTTALECQGCQHRFAVFFASKDDPRNEEYLKRLVEIISREDCPKHAPEVFLNS